MKKETKQVQAEMPYEKFLKYGPESLSEAELLAIILRTGTKDCSSVELGRQILDLAASPHKGLLGLHHISVKDLMQIRGIGEVKAVKIKCLAELSMRMAKAENEPLLRFDAPRTVAGYFMEQLRHEEKEKVVLLCLDNKAQLLSQTVLSTGTVNASLISPREVFQYALKVQAVYIMLLHNHPSGDPKPSRQDMEVTKRLLQTGELMEILLLDHIIIGDNRYISFKEAGIFESGLL